MLLHLGNDGQQHFQRTLVVVLVIQQIAEIEGRLGIEWQFIGSAVILLKTFPVVEFSHFRLTLSVIDVRPYLVEPPNLP